MPGDRRLNPLSRDQQRLGERPGRLAAIGAAVVVCGLSVSGALGLTATGMQAGAGPSRSDVSAPSGATEPAGTQSSHGADEEAMRATKQTGNPPAAARAAAPVALPRRSGHGKRVVFDMSAQRVWLVDANGKVDRTYPVSGSKYRNLGPGSYQVYSRSRLATAYNSSERLNYMVRFTTGRTAPIGFHAIPVRPNGTLVEDRAGLGKPASDGCIRQWITDARALWAFAPVGTTVVVVA